MKTKSILLAALVGAAASATISASAVNFGFSFRLPVPVIITAPVVVTAPIAPAPIVETVPACPGVDYVWAPGYWSHTTTGFAWVRGAWNYHPRVGYGRFQNHDFHGHDFDIALIAGKS